ncbi:MAG: hypothetical protein SVP26_07230 [Chloroflexota bacterium]|nr:hypothetical protein [Chloroflexota bacterium]
MSAPIAFGGGFAGWSEYLAMKGSLLSCVACIALVALLSGTVACAGNIEPQTVPISVPYPVGYAHANVTLEFGAANVNADATGTTLIEGDITYNTEGRHPTIVVDADTVDIVQGGPSGIITGGNVNNWVLHFGGEMPFNMTINAGAYSGEWELGGLPLTALSINEGAADSVFSFSAPNPEAMETLEINTGAGSMALVDVVNANFERLVFNGGAGSLSADLGGELIRSGMVDINAGAASVILLMPEQTPVRVRVGGGLHDVDADAAFERLEGAYVTPGFNAHEGPSLEVEVTLIAGSVRLELE